VSPQTPDQLNSVVTRLFVRLRDHLVHQGASVPAARVLVLLRDNGPMRVTELAAALQVSQPTMSGQLHRLAEQGRVRRAIDTSDGRAVTAELTSAGRALLDSLVTSRSALLTAALARLDDRDRTAIAAATPALGRLADALEDEPLGSADHDSPTAAPARKGVLA
jgi:DNA-binding MarR family transcriptional regulator